MRGDHLIGADQRPALTLSPCCIANIFGLLYSAHAHAHAQKHESSYNARGSRDLLRARNQRETADVFFPLIRRAFTAPLYRARCLRRDEGWLQVEPGIVPRTSPPRPMATPPTRWQRNEQFPTLSPAPPSCLLSWSSSALSSPWCSSESSSNLMETCVSSGEWPQAKVHYRSSRRAYSLTSSAPARRVSSSSRSPPSSFS